MPQHRHRQRVPHQHHIQPRLIRQPPRDETSYAVTDGDLYVLGSSVPPGKEPSPYPDSPRPHQTRSRHSKHSSPISCAAPRSLSGCHRQESYATPTSLCHAASLSTADNSFILSVPCPHSSSRSQFLRVIFVIAFCHPRRGSAFVFVVAICRVRAVLPLSSPAPSPLPHLPLCHSAAKRRNLQSSFSIQHSKQISPRNVYYSIPKSYFPHTRSPDLKSLL